MTEKPRVQVLETISEDTSGQIEDTKKQETNLKTLTEVLQKKFLNENEVLDFRNVLSFVFTGSKQIDAEMLEVFGKKEVSWQIEDGELIIKIDFGSNRNDSEDYSEELKTVMTEYDFTVFRQGSKYIIKKKIDKTKCEIRAENFCIAIDGFVTDFESSATINELVLRAKQYRDEIMASGHHFDLIKMEWDLVTVVTEAYNVAELEDVLDYFPEDSAERKGLVNLLNLIKEIEEFEKRIEQARVESMQVIDEALQESVEDTEISDSVEADNIDNETEVSPDVIDVEPEDYQITGNIDKNKMKPEEMVPKRRGILARLFGRK